MLRTILLSASVAGLLAAIALTLLQTVWITPLIFAAETYENSTPAAHVTTTTNAEMQESGAAPHEHEHADEHTHNHHGDAWQPAAGFERTFFTLISNVVMGVAYALMLAGMYTLWRQPRGIAQGMLFGLAGFAVFFAAPGFGLPPELPGTAAADLGQRQIWWIGTAASTAVALTLLFAQNLLSTRKRWLLRVLGLVILVIPHIVGAPHPVVAASLAPAELQNHFRVATTVGNVIFWLLLGAISAIAWRKFSAPRQTVAQ